MAPVEALAAFSQALTFFAGSSLEWHAAQSHAAPHYMWHSNLQHGVEATMVTVKS